METKAKPKIQVQIQQQKVIQRRDPTPSVWNPDFRYKRSCEMGDNYLHEKFKRIRKQMAEQAAEKVFEGMK